MRTYGLRGVSRAIGEVGGERGGAIKRPPHPRRSIKTHVRVQEKSRPLPSVGAVPTPRRPARGEVPMRTMDNLPSGAGRRHVAERIGREEARRELAREMRLARWDAQHWAQERDAYSKGALRSLEGALDQARWADAEALAARARAASLHATLKRARMVGAS